MSLMAFAFPLAILALLAVSIYEHVNSVKLSLPLSAALTFVTILLPIFAAGNAYLLPYLTRPSAASKPTTSLHHLLRNPLFLQGLQLLQGLLTTVLATLYFQDLVPGDTRACELSTRWQRLFRAKDALSVKTIQDALECCGFRSVRDMAWPFPPTEVRCAARFERSLACREPWTEALQRSAGVNFGVVLAVGLLQVLSIIIARHTAGRNSEASSWVDVFRRFSSRNRHGSYATRPLLTSGQTQTEEVDEEVGRSGLANGQGYGGTEESHGQGPRLEPSGLQQEQNEWRQ